MVTDKINYIVWGQADYKSRIKVWGRLEYQVKGEIIYQVTSKVQIKIWDDIGLMTGNLKSKS